MIQELVGSFVKAKLEIEGAVKKTLPCVFNPSSYSITSGVDYAKQKELGSEQKKQFTGIEGDKLSLSLLFDSESLGTVALNTLVASAAAKKPTEPKAVSVYTNELMKTVMVEASAHEPPKVTFCWGNLEFSGHVTALKIDFTMFTMSGKPIRAKADLTITREASKKPPLESPDRTKYATWTEGMSLWMLADKEYGDCEKWRVIAKANGLLNPFDIKPGQMIRIPAL